MRFAASLTATGLLGFLLLEALKLLMAPVAAWFLGIVMIAAKMALIALGLGLILVVGVFAFRRLNRDRTEAS